MADKKRKLDLQLARDFGYSPTDVGEITRAFLDGIGKELALTGEVTLGAFGKFSIATQPGQRFDWDFEGGNPKMVPCADKVRVHFAKGQGLKDLLKDYKETRHDKRKRDGEVRGR